MQLSIVGKGSGWESAPDFGEVWGITQIILKKPTCSLVIDMNVYEDGRWGEVERKEAARVRELCLDRLIPFIGLDNYPLHQIIKHFGTDYFSNTVDYALALAVFRGYDELDLYGVNMAAENERHAQKAGVDFWCGVAIGRGCMVRVHGGMSTIMRTRDGLVYGYDFEQKVRTNGKTN